jgi:hypothetical protein
MENGLSAADVALLNNDGMGGWNGMIWLFAILALMGGGFGGLGNANNQYATSAEVQRGFDTQNLNSQTSAILGAVNNGTAQSVAATNQTFHDSLMANQNLYNEIARDISSVQLGQANILANQNECCCSTKQLIMQNNYDAAMRDAATNANFTAQIQSVKDMIAQNKIEALQAQINRLELNAATSNVLRFPSSWTYEAGQFPPATVAMA